MGRVFPKLAVEAEEPGWESWEQLVEIEHK